MSTTKTVSAYLVDKVSGAMVLGKGLEVGAAGITFSDGSKQVTASTFNTPVSYNWSPAITVVEGATQTADSTQLAVTGGLALVSLNINALTVNTIASPMVLTVSLSTNGVAGTIFQRQLTYVVAGQTQGANFQGAALITVPAGTTGLRIVAALFDSTSSGTSEVTFTPDVRLDYVPF